MMLACARIGAIHSVVFGGFSRNALRDRIQDSGCKMLITADEGIRGGRVVPLKAEADAALLRVPDGRDRASSSPAPAPASTWSPAATSGTTRRSAPTASRRHCDIEWMDAEDPLFILYTSGSTGKPKGVLHTTGGYLLYAAMTFKYDFDYHDDDVFFCTADIGWVTGHSYIVYGPLCVGATSLMFEGDADLPGRRPLLGDRRQARRQPVLHRPDRHPRAHEARRRVAGEVRPVHAARARHGRRADQPRGVDVVLQATSAGSASRSSTPGGRRRPAAT